MDIIEEADWSGERIVGRAHDGVTFVDVDLSDATVSECTFTDCTFRRVRFQKSTHERSAFLRCTFVDCSFFAARFVECKLVGSAFERCTVRGLVAAGGDWSLVGLAGADLTGSQLRDLRMREIDLSQAKAPGVWLRDCDLSAAWLAGADLSGADLRGSDLTGLDPTVTRVRGAVITWEQAVQVAVGLGLDVRPDDDDEAAD